MRRLAGANCSQPAAIDTYGTPFPGMTTASTRHLRRHERDLSVSRIEASRSSSTPKRSAVLYLAFISVITATRVNTLQFAQIDTAVNLDCRPNLGQVLIRTTTSRNSVSDAFPARRCGMRAAADSRDSRRRGGLDIRFQVNPRRLGSREAGGASNVQSPGDTTLGQVLTHIAGFALTVTARVHDIKQNRHIWQSSRCGRFILQGGRKRHPMAFVISLEFSLRGMRFKWCRVHLAALAMSSNLS
jgi:hypothetical protein